MVKIVWFLLIIVGFSAGILAGREVWPKPVEVEYISQSELLELEKTRLAQQDLTNRALFLGKPERAIELIKQIQKKQNNNTNIVLLSEQKIYGDKVKSISRKVHNQVISKLGQED